jgi:hypothetical protein
MSLTRENILAALENALKPLPYVHAMWQGGAASFDRVDEWSDIDLQVVVDDDRIPDVYAVVDETLQKLSSINLRYDFPQPVWHGHYQTFYRLEDAGPYLLIDFVAMKLSNENRFLQPEIHGTAIINFDKANLVKTPPLDIDAHLKAIQGRIDTLRVLFEMFQVLTLKEIHRGNSIEAISFYQSWTLRPLVEVLRIRHDPARYNFQYYFPKEDVVRLEPLFFIASVQDLETKFKQASDWFREALPLIDMEVVRRQLEQESKQHFGV